MKNLNNSAELYNAIEKIAGKHVKHYREDLTKHDKAEIERDSETPFIHIARQTGTAMQRFYNLDTYPDKGERIKYLFGTANRLELIRSIKTSLEYYINNTPKTILYWSGKELKRITPPEAMELFKQYERQINNAWDEAERKEQTQYETI